MYETQAVWESGLQLSTLSDPLFCLAVEPPASTGVAAVSRLQRLRKMGRVTFGVFLYHTYVSVNEAGLQGFQSHDQIFFFFQLFVTQNKSELQVQVCTIQYITKVMCDLIT